MFVSRVYTTVAGTCGSCHSEGQTEPAFVAGDADRTYELITLEYPELIDTFQRTALILDPHEGAYVFSAAERNTIEAWLRLE